MGIVLFLFVEPGSNVFDPATAYRTIFFDEVLKKK